MVEVLVDRVGAAERGRDERGRRERRALPEVERRGGRRRRRRLRHALDLHALDAEPAQHRAARRGDRGDAAEREREQRQRDGERGAQAAPGGAPRRLGLETRTHARRHVGLGRPLDRELAEPGLEAHSSASSRASARDSRDLTVPGRHPSAAAVSRSVSPRRWRQATTCRCSSPSVSIAASSCSRCSRARSAASGDGAASRGGALLGQVQLEPRAARRRAPAVARLVGDDREQPRAQRRVLAEAAERAVRLHEGVLHGLLGVGGRASDDVCGAEGDPLVLADELFVGVEIPALGARDELRFSAWPAHHCPFYTRAPTSVPAG